MLSCIPPLSGDCPVHSPCRTTLQVLTLVTEGSWDTGLGSELDWMQTVAHGGAVSLGSHRVSPNPGQRRGFRKPSMARKIESLNRIVVLGDNHRLQIQLCHLLAETLD